MVAMRVRLAHPARALLRAALPKQLSNQCPHAFLSATHAACNQALVSRSSVRLYTSSSSRFLSLADDDEEGQKRAKRSNEDGNEDESAEQEDSEEDEIENEDGAVAFDDEYVEINEGGVDLCEETDDEIMNLHLHDPVKWTVEKLARKFQYSKARVEAVICLNALDEGLEIDQLKEKIDIAKEEALQRHEAAKKEAEALEQSGDEAAMKKFQKRKQKEEKEEEDLEQGDAMELEDDDDFFRNPEYFFLHDEFEGYPPLVRRLGKHAKTDKLYPEEALALQKLAGKNKVDVLKSFAKPTDVKRRWKIAVKDISKTKKPLYIQDKDRTLRLAGDEEVMPRTWVRRPPYFRGLGQ